MRLALTTPAGRAVELETDLIESVEEHNAHDDDSCIVTMTSGKEFEIARSFRYVTGVMRKENA